MSDYGQKTTENKNFKINDRLVKSERLAWMSTKIR